MSDASADGIALPTTPRIFGWHGAAVTAGIAALLAVAQASQLVWATANFGFAIPWSRALIGNLVETGLWALLVPLIFALSRRFPLQDGRWALHLPVHVLGAVLASLVFASSYTALQEWVLPESWHLSLRPPRPGGPPPPGERFEPESGTSERARRVRRFQAPSFRQHVQFLIMRQGSLHFLTYVVIVGVWHWRAQQHRLRDRDRQARELSRQLANARLEALRMQLNPHFLFNTLNAIATLVHRNPQAADDMIACLSDFLRLTLNSATTPENPLHKELEFARRYLDIEKLRFGDRLVLRETIEPESLSVRVPTLVLQPLLENAVRHGIEPGEQGGEIHIAARREGSELVLTVSDTGPGLATPKEGRTGIGLANTRARLQQIHGTSASIQLNERPGGGLAVELRVPFSPNP